MKLSEYDDEDIIEEVKHRGMTFKGFTTKELVEELRKREGVEAFDVKPDKWYVLQMEADRLICPDKGPAIILRIID